MAIFMKLTQMNGIPVLIGTHGIKMIESYEFTPRPLDMGAKAEVAKDSAPAPVTTQQMVPPGVSPGATKPIVCSKITFMDDKELAVMELIANIVQMAG